MVNLDNSCFAWCFAWTRPQRGNKLLKSSNLQSEIGYLIAQRMGSLHQYPLLTHDKLAGENALPPSYSLTTQFGGILLETISNWVDKISHGFPSFPSSHSMQYH